MKIKELLKSGLVEKVSVKSLLRITGCEYCVMTYGEKKDIFMFTVTKLSLMMELRRKGITEVNACKSEYSSLIFIYL